MGWEREGDLLIETGQCTLHEPVSGSAFRLRPLRVVSEIRIKRTPRRKETNTPLAFFASFVGKKIDLRPLDIEGGHLVGIQLGGIDKPENIAPLYSHVNRGTYAAAEAAIASAYVTGQNQGVVVELTYGGDDPRIPSAVTLRQVAGLEIDFDRFAYRYERQLHVWTLSNAPAAVSRIAIDPEILAFIERAQTTIRSGWRLEGVDETAAGWARADRLPPPENRPYACLDWIMLDAPNNRVLPMETGIGTISPGKDFSERQRELVQLVNRYRQRDARRGECWSDVADDPIKHALIDLGADSGVEIDHIVPKASNGVNAFSNAQVASASFNRSKGRPTS